MSTVRRARWALLGAAVSAALGCRSPQADALIYQQLNDAADQFATVRNDMGHLNDQIDSLRLVIAKQDSLIRRVANLAGVPLGPSGGDGR